MKIICEATGNKIPYEIKGFVSHILKRHGDCESLLKNNTWFGNRLGCTLLFCSYGVIGYSMEYKGWSIDVDNDLDEIRID